MAQTHLLGIHRLAARFDNRFDFVYGVSQKIKKKKGIGESLGLDPDRCYNIIKHFKSRRSDGLQA